MRGSNEGRLRRVVRRVISETRYSPPSSWYNPPDEISKGFMYLYLNHGPNGVLMGEAGRKTWIAKRDFDEAVRIAGPDARDVRILQRAAQRTQLGGEIEMKDAHTITYPIEATLNGHVEDALYYIFGFDAAADMYSAMEEEADRL